MVLNGDYATHQQYPFYENAHKMGTYTIYLSAPSGSKRDIKAFRNSFLSCRASGSNVTGDFQPFPMAGTTPKEVVNVYIPSGK